MGNLFTTLLNSTNALQVYGRSLSVIQNNITNANTPGYVKQDQSLIPLPFNPAIGVGGGVMAGPLITARSEYLEQAVRDQQTLFGSAQQRAADLGQVESLFDVTSKSGVPAALNQLFGSFSQLSVNPNDPVARQGVIDAAGQAAQAFNQNAIGISRVAMNIDSQTRGAVAEINQIASQIAGINQHYRTNLQANQDPGLDAQLHSALESLAQVANFSVIKSGDGGISVYLGGETPLVIGDHQFPVTGDFSGPTTILRDWQGSDITSEVTGGRLGALLEDKNKTLPAYTNTLNNLAQGLADSVNTALGQGIDKNGNTPSAGLFTYNAAQGAAFTLAVTGITPDQIAAALPAAPGGNGNALAVSQLAGQPLVNGFTFTQAYGNLGGRVGGDVAGARQEQTAQQNALTQAQALRSSQTGVSLDEEAAKLLQFQQSYQAVGKLVMVIDSLTQTLMDIVR